MKKKNIVLTVIALVLCVTLLLCIPAFADDGYADDSANMKSENLMLSNVESVTSNNGSKNAEKIYDGDIKSAWKASAKTDALTVTFNSPVSFNTAVIREKNWKINSFQLSYNKGTAEQPIWEMFYKQDCIEDFRLCAFETVTTTQLKFEVTDAKSKFSIREIELYNEGKQQKDSFRVSNYLPLPEMKNGSAFDPESDFYYQAENCAVINQLHIIAAACWDDEGNLVINDGYTKETLKADIKRIRDLYGNNDVQIFATVFFNQCNPTIVLTEYKDVVIKNTVDFLLEIGFDGVSYDWEYPVGEQWELFDNHLVTLKKELSKHNLLLSCAMSAFNVQLSKEAIASLDQVEIMSYDNFDHTGNHSSFISGAVQPLTYFLEKGFKREQLNLGLPFYARPTDGGGIWINYDVSEYTPTDRFQNLSDNMWFSGVQMTEDKVAYAISQDLGGVMIFHASMDIPYENEFTEIKAIESTISSRITFSDKEA